MANNENNKTRKNFVALRFNDTEWESVLRHKELRGDKSVSETIRYLIFDAKKQAEFSLSTKDEKQIIVQGLDLLYPEFKKTVSLYEKFFSYYKKALKEFEKSSNNNSFFDATQRLVVTFSGCTNTLIDQINNFLSFVGADEKQFKRLKANPGGLDEKSSNNNNSKLQLNKLMNLEYITLHGRVFMDAIYADEQKKRIRFSLVVEKREKSGVKSQFYLVYSNNADMIDELKKGVCVMVNGSISCGVNKKTENMVALIVESKDMFVTAPAGSAVNYMEKITLHGKISSKPEIFSMEINGTQQNFLKFYMDVESSSSKSKKTPVTRYLVRTAKVSYEDFLEENMGVFVIGNFNAAVSSASQSGLNLMVNANEIQISK